MKRFNFFPLIIFGLLPLSLSAQFKADNDSKWKLSASPFYASMGWSRNARFALSSGAFTRQGWGGALSWNILRTASENRPADFDRGPNLFGASWFGPGRYEVEGDRISIYSIRMLKMFAIKAQGIYWGVEAGPSFMRGKIADHFVPNPCSVNPIFGEDCGPNYTYEIVPVHATGLSVKGYVAMKLAKGVGFELGVLYVSPGVASPQVGVDASLTFGKFRK